MLIKVHDKPLELSNSKKLHAINYDKILHAYVKDRTLDRLSGCTSKSIYEDYLEYCMEKEIKNTLNSNQFKKRMCNAYPIISIPTYLNGKTMRIWYKKD